MRLILHAVKVAGDPVPESASGHERKEISGLSRDVTILSRVSNRQFTAGDAVVFHLVLLLRGFREGAKARGGDVRATETEAKYEASGAASRRVVVVGGEGRHNRAIGPHRSALSTTRTTPPTRDAASAHRCRNIYPGRCSAGCEEGCGKKKKGKKGNTENTRDPALQLPAIFMPRRRWHISKCYAAEKRSDLSRAAIVETSRQRKKSRCCCRRS